MDRSLIHKKFNESPYKEFDLTPAELKYTSFIHGFEQEGPSVSNRKTRSVFDNSAQDIKDTPNP